MWFKFLDKDGLSPIAKASWPLPSKNEDGTWTYGEWTKVRKQIQLCLRGWHLARESGLYEWANEQLYIAEPNPAFMVMDWHIGKRKSVFHSARLLRRVESYPGLKAVVSELGLLALDKWRDSDNFGYEDTARVVEEFLRGQRDDAVEVKAIFNAEHDSDDNYCLDLRDCLYCLFTEDGGWLDGISNTSANFVNEFIMGFVRKEIGDGEE